LEKDDVYEELEELIGTEATNRLVNYYAGSSIYIPKRIANEQQYQQIRVEFKKGASYRELAMRYGYSERYIRRIVHKTKAKTS
jgi:Mor family transcriptional regulator